MPFESVLGLHVTHKWCEVDELEAASTGDTESALSHLMEHDSVRECVVMETCNRVEIYVYAEDKEEGRKVLLDFAEHNMDLNVERSIQFTSGEEALRHLMEVSSGIDSMVVGEDQILGQVREAYELAKKRGTVHKFLDLAFTKAINVGKKVRTETGINRGAVSVGTVSVDMAEEVLGSLEGRDILVIGAGEMATSVVKCLAEKAPGRITVANRTLSRAEELARQAAGSGVKFSRFTEFLPDADLVISATGAPHPIIEKEDLEGVERTLKLLILDISNPRDVSTDVEELPGITRIDLDGLEAVTTENRRRRRSEAKKVEGMIEQELDLLLRGFEEKQVDNLVGHLHMRAARIRERELKKALQRLGEEDELSDRQVRIIDDMSRSVLGSLLADPTGEIKRAAREDDEEFLSAVRRMFRLEQPVISR
ncbi:MAG: Glutamyl-tRNA reductase [Methanonatronarchaeales archaeon]|nr:Glutamyl-tRNA reductase [Methanonatronarchaeales archaeon]